MMPRDAMISIEAEKGVYDEGISPHNHVRVRMGRNADYIYQI